MEKYIKSVLVFRNYLKYIQDDFFFFQFKHENANYVSITTKKLTQVHIHFQ